MLLEPNEPNYFLDKNITENPQNSDSEKRFF